MASQDIPDSAILSDDAERLLDLIDHGLDSPMYLGDESATEQLLGLQSTDERPVSVSVPSTAQIASPSEYVPSGGQPALPSEDKVVSDCESA